MHIIGTKKHRLVRKTQLCSVIYPQYQINDRYGSNIARIFIGVNVREDENLATLDDCILLRSNINKNSVSVHIGQYLLLESYFEFLCANDEIWTLVLETLFCTWNPLLHQFKRCYVYFSYVKEFWARNGCTPLFAVDGTFTTSGIIKHTVETQVYLYTTFLIIVQTYDGMIKDSEW